MEQQLLRPVWAEINLDHLKHNLNEVKKITKKKHPGLCRRQGRCLWPRRQGNYQHPGQPWGRPAGSGYHDGRDSTKKGRGEAADPDFRLYSC